MYVGGHGKVKKGGNRKDKRLRKESREKESKKDREKKGQREREIYKVNKKLRIWVWRDVKGRDSEG